MKSGTKNNISLTRSLWGEFKRRYATRSFRLLIRGLKPTATIMWSLLDRACPRGAGGYTGGMIGRNRHAECDKMHEEE